MDQKMQRQVMLKSISIMLVTLNVVIAALSLAVLGLTKLPDSCVCVIWVALSSLILST
jgi:hypothetical protein